MPWVCPCGQRNVFMGLSCLACDELPAAPEELSAAQSTDTDGRRFRSALPTGESLPETGFDVDEPHGQPLATGRRFRFSVETEPEIEPEPQPEPETETELIDEAPAVLWSEVDRRGAADRRGSDRRAPLEVVPEPQSDPAPQLGEADLLEASLASDEAPAQVLTSRPDTSDFDALFPPPWIIGRDELGPDFSADAAPRDEAEQSQSADGEANDYDEAGWMAAAPFTELDEHGETEEGSAEGTWSGFTPDDDDDDEDDFWGGSSEWDSAPDQFSDDDDRQGRELQAAAGRNDTTAPWWLDNGLGGLSLSPKLLLGVDGGPTTPDVEDAAFGDGDDNDDDDDDWFEDSPTAEGRYPDDAYARTTEFEDDGDDDEDDDGYLNGRLAGPGFGALGDVSDLFDRSADLDTPDEFETEDDWTNVSDDDDGGRMQNREPIVKSRRDSGPHSGRSGRANEARRPRGGAGRKPAQRRKNAFGPGLLQERSRVTMVLAVVVALTVLATLGRDVFERVAAAPETGSFGIETCASADRVAGTKRVADLQPLLAPALAGWSIRPDHDRSTGAIDFTKALRNEPDSNGALATLDETRFRHGFDRAYAGPDGFDARTVVSEFASSACAIEYLARHRAALTMTSGATTFGAPVLPDALGISTATPAGRSYAVSFPYEHRAVVVTLITTEKVAPTRATNEILGLAQAQWTHLSSASAQ